MDTTNVTEPKPLKAETEAQEGPEDAEPPLEEPSLPPNADTREKDKEEELNDEPLDEFNKPPGLSESMTFKEVYQLKERYIPLGSEINQITRQRDLTDSETGKPLGRDLEHKLMNIEYEPDWEFAAVDASDAYTMAYDAALGAAMYDNPAYLILEGNDPAGIIMFASNDTLPDRASQLLNKNTWNKNIKCITEIFLVGFKKNSITLVKDIFTLMDKMIEDYEYICWTANNDAPCKKMYDRIYKSNRYKMKTSDPECADAGNNHYTQYVIIGRKHIKE